MLLDLQMFRASDFMRVGSHCRPAFQASKERLAQLASTSNSAASIGSCWMSATSSLG